MAPPSPLAASPPPPPPPNATLTFAQFQARSLAYLAHRDRVLLPTAAAPTSPSLSWLTYATQWTWLAPLHPGPAFEGTTGLVRSFALAAPPPAERAEGDDGEVVLDEDEVAEAVGDEAAVGRTGARVVTVHQTIAWSKIWRLPVLFFHAHTERGEPVQLDQLAQLGVVHSRGTLCASQPPPSPPPLHAGSGAAQQQQEVAQGTAAPISVADHPRTGLPSYYLHPCHTDVALREVWRHHHNCEREGNEDGGYVAAFVSLCASAVEMRAC
ncbi:hypothetical protein EX895_005732 [Sporisorium graminicola]|uniref:Ubiquitin-like-conjugating enzyme ATG10 n=1 Tax=Sporisorium graminicola TaxID=280036 RepID=A0A4U7KMR1_9BASI|nr:hypothetical protein EX895_005732 [Sporisorium graminicola]TKY85570.1 hypothetical protein EX895_005732 [Sporisorium graminicola]